MGQQFNATVSSVQDATLITDFVYDLTKALRVRQASWAETLGFVPPGLRLLLEGRLPVDISTTEVRKSDGEDKFTGLNDTYVPYAIEKFYQGIEESPSRLKDPVSGRILQWQAAPKRIAKKWSTFSNKKIAALLGGGKASGAVWTGGANFFGTGHKFNPKKSSLGTFSNLLGNNGGIGPWYMLLNGDGWGMFPWAVVRGEGDPPAQNAGSFRTADGMNITVFDYASEHYAKYGTLRIKSEASYGFALLHPQSIVRAENAVTYANVKAAVDALRTMKDLDGDEAAEDMSMTILAPKGLLSDFEAVLGREMVDVGGVSVTNDLRTKGIKLVGLTS